MDEPEHSSAETALIHLYRAEVGRMTTYRVRLDTTTNWAILTTAGAATFALGNDEVSHVVILMAMLFTFYFMYLEARRFQVYEMAYQRVRLLERHFYRQLLGEAADGSWRTDLLALMNLPRSRFSRLEAIGWRLRRNYLGIHLALAVVWLLKLANLEVGGAVKVEELLEHAAVGPMPGRMVLVAVAVYIATVCVIAAASRFPERLAAE